MKFHNQHVVIVLASSLLVSAAHGMRPAEREQACPPATTVAQVESHPDRVLFDQLARDVKTIDLQSHKLMDQALTEARGDNGHVDFETKARLLSMRDQRDRLHARLLILSARHDWVVPAFKTRTTKITNTQETMDGVFGSIDVLVQRRLTLEAKHIVEMVPLPVVSMEAMPR